MQRSVIGIFLGTLIGFGAGIVTAQSFTRWDKSEVLPVVIVEPSLGRFKPKDGSLVQASWDKDEVTPMCLVKPNVGRFIPVEGFSAGNIWQKDEVKPFLRVKYSAGSFVPADSY